MQRRPPPGPWEEEAGGGWWREVRGATVPVADSRPRLTRVSRPSQPPCEVAYETAYVTYFGHRPSRSSTRQRAISWTTPASVLATAVHSCARLPAFCTSALG